MKRIICFVLTMALFCGMAPITTYADAKKTTVWRFDFATKNGQAKEGYLPVTEDMHVINSCNRDYGFIGTNEKDYRLHGGRIDGFIQQEGQVIDLVQTKNGIGSNGIKDKAVKDFNSGDYYPVRFALKAEEDAYYKVKATITTLDSEKGGYASLYTERKHPVFTEKYIAPSEKVTGEFTVRVTPIYYEKSDPKGLVEDKYVNICLLGENTAFSEIVIEKIPSAPTMWILGDSTVTDGGGNLPFFPLSNYTGVGTAVTKYITESIAVVNEGEGGLSAHDNNHFNVVKDRIKEGDFLWVEYGHNHKSDSVPGYESAIGKYYDACKRVGATLILVGPIDRINNYDKDTNTWHSSLKGFSDAAKKFVDEKLIKDKNDKVAFVDLNAPSLKWFGEVTKEGVVKGEKYTNEKRLVYYYFQASPWATDVDHTHPNDTGAESLAYLFFENADCKAYPALKPVLERFLSGKAEKPTVVGEDILKEGFPANKMWPQYQVGKKAEYPLEIIDVEAEGGKIVAIKCRVIDKNLLSSYAAAFVEADGKIYQTTIESHIDNSAANNSSIYTLYFDKNNLPPEKDNSRIYMAGVDMADNDKPLENIKSFSRDYTPGDYSAFLLATTDTDEERFEYYGYDSLTGSGEWASGGKVFTEKLIEENGESYAHLSGDSFTFARNLTGLSSGTGTEGRYEFYFDIADEMKGTVSFALSNGWRNSAPFIQGNSIELVKISDGIVLSDEKEVAALSEGKTRVHCVLDMDEGFLLVKCGDGEIRRELYVYQSYEKPKTEGFYKLVISSNGQADIKIAEAFGGKCNKYEKTKTTVEILPLGGEYGFCSIDQQKAERIQLEAGRWVTLTATAYENGRFLGWYLDGREYSVKEEISVRMYKDISLQAKFSQQTPKTDVKLVYSFMGEEIKTVVAEYDNEGRELHEEMKFSLSEEYKEPVIKENNGYMDIYTFVSADKEQIEQLGKQGENVIRLNFEYDGKYVLYEDFENVDSAWGFDNEAKKGDGVIYLLTGVGTSNRKSSVKVMDEAIRNLKKLTVKFTWKNDVDTAKGRNSSFDLTDDDNNLLFSIRAKGKDGISFVAGEEKEAVISNNYLGVNDIYEISVSADFHRKKVWGEIVNTATGKVTVFEEAETRCAYLGKILGAYGYSSASQQLYFFAVRDDMENGSVVRREGTMVTVKLSGKRDGVHNIIAGIYDGEKLLGICTKNASLMKNEEKEITFDTKLLGEVRIFVK